MKIAPFSVHPKSIEQDTASGKRKAAIVAIVTILALGFIGGMGVVVATSPPNAVNVTCFPSSIALRPLPPAGHAACIVKVVGGYGFPSGRVTWSSDQPGRFVSPLVGGSCRLNSHGYCRVTYIPRGAGPTNIMANYLGDAIYDPASGTFALNVNPSHTRTIVTCRPTAVMAGSSTVITCRAIVKGFRPVMGSIMFTQTGIGMVTFVTVDTCTLGTGGSCSVTLTGTTAGGVVIHAAFTPADGNNLPSTGVKALSIKP